LEPTLQTLAQLAVNVRKPPFVTVSAAFTNKKNGLEAAFSCAVFERQVRAGFANLFRQTPSLPALSE